MKATLILASLAFSLCTSFAQAFAALAIYFCCVSQSQAAVLATQVNPANGHTYHLLDEASWTDSEAEAISLGGHLATINDAAEDAWVFSTFSGLAITAEPTNALKKSYFVGLNDEMSVGDFVWSSGKPVAYTNWLPGQPENNETDEDYAGVLLNFEMPGQWHDIVSDTRAGDTTYGIVEVVPEPTSVILACFSIGIMFMCRKSKRAATLAALAICFCCVSQSQAAQIAGGGGVERSDDLFDVSQGGIVTNASPQCPLGGVSDARSAIGFSSSFVAPTNTIFINGGSTGQIDFVEFQTPSPIQLTGFELWLRDDSIFSGNPWRGATSFRLLASSDGIVYSEISQSSIANDYLSSYGDDNIVISDTLPDIVSQYFRLELTRFDTTGIRIIEIDGFGSIIPEPSSLLLTLFAALGSVGRTRRRKGN